MMKATNAHSNPDRRPRLRWIWSLCLSFLRKVTNDVPTKFLSLWTHQIKSPFVWIWFVLLFFLFFFFWLIDFECAILTHPTDFDKIMVFDVQGYKVSLSTHQMWHQSKRNIALGNHPAQHTFTRFCKEIRTILTIPLSPGFEISFIGFLTFCDFHAKLLLIDTWYMPSSIIIYFTFTFVSVQKDLLESLPLSMVVLSAVYTGGSEIW